MVSDVPVDYSGYRPVNYDDTYSGVVSVETALTRSLNVPAVNLYAQLGDRGLYGFLREAGVSSLTGSKEHYGLSLVLGGCEISLLELTELYSGLARGGDYVNCRLLIDQPAGSGKKLVSADCCYILADILSKLRRPELPAIWDWTVDRPRIAWKTGPSYGHHDAWCVGFNPRYTVGVWAGNFDGKGVTALVGAEIAAPILFDIFAAVSVTGTEAWFSQPENVAERRVCSVSGSPAGPHCPATTTELYIPGVSPEQECRVHQAILVDDSSGLKLCNHCRQGRQFHEEVYEIWPAEVAVWLERNGHPVDHLPRHWPECSKPTAGKGPESDSPLDGASYCLRTEVTPAYQKILLDAKVSNESAGIFWFVDQELVYNGPASEKVFIEAEPGLHKITCMDSEGLSSEAVITVQREGHSAEM
jgi:penicillin-binding protein 1C